MQSLKYWLYALASPAMAVAFAWLAGPKFLQAIATGTYLNYAILILIGFAVVLYLRCLWSGRGDFALLTEHQTAPQEVEARLERGDAGLLSTLSATLISHTFKLKAKPGSQFDLARIREEYDYIRDSLLDRLRLPVYVTLMLVALGLFGIFFGFIETLAGLRQLLTTYSEQTHNPDIWPKVFMGIRETLGSMGVTFTAPLFAIGGAIMLGFMNLAVRSSHSFILRRIRLVLSEVSNLGGSSMIPAAQDKHSVFADFSTKLLDAPTGFVNESNKANTGPMSEGLVLQLETLNASLRNLEMTLREQQKWLAQMNQMLSAHAEQSRKFDEFTLGLGAALQVIHQNQKDGFDQLIQAVRAQGK